MNISECSEKLRELSEDYSSQRILVDEYRTSRKHLLDDLDRSLNGQNIDVLEDEALKDNDQSIKEYEADDESVTNVDDIFDISEDTHNNTNT